MLQDLDVPDRLYPGFVYVLRLEDDCLYVGYTTDPEVRIPSHFLGRGAQWTALHKPVGIKSIQPGDTQLENCLTLALMCQFGWQKVRGGIYCDVNMTIAPPPIRRAYNLTLPAKIIEIVEPQTICGHNVLIQQIKKEGSNTDWRAKITGLKADAECPKTGKKTIYAATEEELRQRVQNWLGICQDDHGDLQDYA